MSIFIAVILGIVEGLTEFLPVSSTGHLILVSSLLGLSATAFQSSFEIAIQLGAIMAVVVVFAKRIWQHPRVLIPVAAAFVPTAIVGFAFYSVIKTYLLSNPSIVIWSLAIGGLIMLISEVVHQQTTYKSVQTTEYGMETPTIKQAVIIGLCQALAVIPGVSRSAATIVGGMALKIPRTTIVEFSFLLAIPTMAAATGYDLLKTGATFTGAEWGYLVVGALTAFIVALATVKWLLGYVKNNNFMPFAAYRFFIAFVFMIVFLTQM
jgi:undecaprenyl-diphosphatase